MDAWMTGVPKAPPPWSSPDTKEGFKPVGFHGNGFAVSQTSLVWVNLEAEKHRCCCKQPPPPPQRERERDEGEWGINVRTKLTQSASWELERSSPPLWRCREAFEEYFLFMPAPRSHGACCNIRNPFSFCTPHARRAHAPVITTEQPDELPLPQ